MTPAGRVLVVGPSGTGHMAWFLALALRRLHWQVAVLDDRQFIGRGLPGVAGQVVQLLERDHRLTGRSRALGRVLRERARGCDLVITVKGEYFLPEDVAAVSSSVPFANWHPDHPVLAQDLACIPHYTAFCPKDSWSTQRLRNMGFHNVTTLPHASDPHVLHGERREPAAKAFSVVGSGYPYRRHWIDVAAGEGLEAHTFGGASPSDGSGVRVAEQAVGAAQGDALRTGCFTLNTHHPFDIAGGNQRVFDAAAAGAPQLTEQLPESVKHFKPGSEIATFEDEADFREKVAELSSNQALRERLARNSHDRVRDEHTYEHRVQTLVAML
jgi:spore maturation protein CgeB